MGRDVFGQFVSETLARRGVDACGIRVANDADTSQTLIINVAGQDRRFIHSFGANAEFRAADIPLEQVRQSRVLYLGGYLVMPNVRQEDALHYLLGLVRNRGFQESLEHFLRHLTHVWPLAHLSNLNWHSNLSRQ